MVVPGQHTDALSRLPVPDPDCLVVTGGQDPGIFVMEHRGSDVVKMTQEGEDTSPLFIVPDLDLVVITSRHKQRLLLVEVHPTHRSIMFIKLVQESAHSVVPQLDNSIMKGGQHPGSVDMEGQTLHPGGLGLELGQHVHCKSSSSLI